MNKMGKLVLTATSIAPILGALAVNFATKSNLALAFYCLLAGTGSVVVCYLLLLVCQSLPEEPLNTVKVKAADKEVLSFLVVYLLPLFTKDLIYAGDWLTPIYVIIIIAACIYNSNTFTFNPIMSLMGFHFYEVEIEDGLSYLLITRQIMRRNINTVIVREISDYIYLQI